MRLVVTELAPVFQLYVYGPLPPEAVAVTDPVVPLQTMFVVTTLVAVNPPLLVILVVVVLLQPLASVTVTV